MSEIRDYTLFYLPEDGKMHKGVCREEKEQLIDVAIGDVVEIGGFRGNGAELVLDGFEFETTADIALVVPADTTVVLEDGRSFIKLHVQGPQANLAALYSRGNLTITGGKGTLVCDATTSTAENTLWSRCICCRYGDLTITGGRIEAHCGACSRNGGAIYAGGRLFGGENEHGAITITGGTVVAASHPQAVRATNTLLTIGPNSVVENASEFSGSVEEWHGDCLSQADTSKDIVVRFN